MDQIISIICLKSMLLYIERKGRKNGGCGGSILEDNSRITSQLLPENR